MGNQPPTTNDPLSRIANYYIGTKLYNKNAQVIPDYFSSNPSNKDLFNRLCTLPIASNYIDAAKDLLATFEFDPNKGKSYSDLIYNTIDNTIDTPLWACYKLDSGTFPSASNPQYYQIPTKSITNSIKTTDTQEKIVSIRLTDQGAYGIVINMDDGTGDRVITYGGVSEKYIPFYYSTSIASQQLQYLGCVSGTSNADVVSAISPRERYFLNVKCMGTVGDMIPSNGCQQTYTFSCDLYVRNEFDIVKQGITNGLAYLYNDGELVVFDSNSNILFQSQTSDVKQILDYVNLRLDKTKSQLLVPIAGSPRNKQITQGQSWITPNGLYILTYDSDRFLIKPNIFATHLFNYYCNNGGKGCKDKIVSFCEKNKISSDLFDYMDRHCNCIFTDANMKATGIAIFGKEFWEAHSQDIPIQCLTPCESMYSSSIKDDTQQDTYWFDSASSLKPCGEVVICQTDIKTDHSKIESSKLIVNQNCGNIISSCKEEKDCNEIGYTCSNNMCTKVCKNGERCPDRYECGSDGLCKPSGKLWDFVVDSPGMCNEYSFGRYTNQNACRDEWKKGDVSYLHDTISGQCVPTYKDGYKSMDECQSKKIAYVCDRSIEALPSCNLVEYDDKDGIPKDSYESIERCQSNCKKSTNKLLIGIGIGVTVLLILIFITLSTRRPLSREVPRL